MDFLTSEQRSANMRQIKSKGMKPEMIVRRLVHNMGYRFRLHRNDLPGKPDLTFPKRKKIIFIHGCFWHQHQDTNCSYMHSPRSNSNYWEPKLRRNIDRDIRTRHVLEQAGWKVLVIWECELKDLNSLSERLHSFLD